MGDGPHSYRDFSAVSGYRFLPAWQMVRHHKKHCAPVSRTEKIRPPAQTENGERYFIVVKPDLSFEGPDCEASGKQNASADKKLGTQKTMKKPRGPSDSSRVPDAAQSIKVICSNPLCVHHLRGSPWQKVSHARCRRKPRFQLREHEKVHDASADNIRSNFEKYNFLKPLALKLLRYNYEERVDSDDCSSSEDADSDGSEAETTPPATPEQKDAGADWAKTAHYGIVHFASDEVAIRYIERILYHIKSSDEDAVAWRKYFRLDNKMFDTQSGGIGGNLNDQSSAVKKYNGAFDLFVVWTQDLPQLVCSAKNHQTMVSSTRGKNENHLSLDKLMSDVYGREREMAYWFAANGSSSKMKTDFAGFTRGFCLRVAGLFMSCLCLNETERMLLWQVASQIKTLSGSPRDYYFMCSTLPRAERIKKLLQLAQQMLEKTVENASNNVIRNDSDVIRADAHLKIPAGFQKEESRLICFMGTRAFLLKVPELASIENGHVYKERLRPILEERKKHNLGPPLGVCLDSCTIGDREITELVRELWPGDSRAALFTVAGCPVHPVFTLKDDIDSVHQDHRTFVACVQIMLRRFSLCSGDKHIEKQIDNLAKLIRVLDTEPKTAGYNYISAEKDCFSRVSLGEKVGGAAAVPTGQAAKVEQNTLAGKWMTKFVQQGQNNEKMPASLRAVLRNYSRCPKAFRIGSGEYLYLPTGLVVMALGVNREVAHLGFYTPYSTLDEFHVELARLLNFFIKPKRTVPKRMKSGKTPEEAESASKKHYPLRKHSIMKKSVKDTLVKLKHITNIRGFFRHLLLFARARKKMGFNMFISTTAVERFFAELRRALDKMKQYTTLAQTIQMGLFYHFLRKTSAKFADYKECSRTQSKKHRLRDPILDWITMPEETGAAEWAEIVKDRNKSLREMSSMKRSYLDLKAGGDGFDGECGSDHPDPVDRNKSLGEMNSMKRG